MEFPTRNGSHLVPGDVDLRVERGTFVSLMLMEKDPDLVQRFVNAYMQAFQWTIDNPQEAAALLAGSRPQWAENEQLFLAQIQADVEETFTSEVTEKNGLGYMDAGAWEATVEILERQNVLNAPVEPAQAFDNQFVEKAARAGT
jgi:NitT/TauT family transport system substrate-binding protein